MAATSAWALGCADCMIAMFVTTREVVEELEEDVVDSTEVMEGSVVLTAGG